MQLDTPNSYDVCPHIGKMKHIPIYNILGSWTKKKQCSKHRTKSPFEVLIVVGIFPLNNRTNPLPTKF